MPTKFLLPAIAAAASLNALAPAAASAQSFGVYVGSGYSNYAYPDRGYYQPRDEDEGHEAWLAHERWEQRRAWEQRQRWEEQEQRRRYWQHERQEDHREWHRGDDDDQE